MNPIFSFRQLLAMLCVAILPAFLVPPAFAQTTIAGWDFNGYTGAGSSPQAPTTTNANVTVTGLTRGSAFGTTGSPAGNAWGTSISVTNLSSATTAVASNSYATFAVKANSGYTLSLSNIAAYNVRRSSTGPTSGQWQYSTNGTTFTDIGTPITWGTTTTASGNTQSAINLSGISALQSLPSSVTVVFRIAVWGATGPSGSWYLNNYQTNSDFILIGSTAASGPLINVTGSLAPLNTTAGTVSAAQTFNASGTALTADITVIAPADFEVATDGTTFGDTATITQSGGLANGTVSVRIKSTATVGAKSGSILLSSAGATDASVPVTGTVTAAGTPVVSLSTSSISNLSTSVGIASAATNYVVTGTNLGTTGITITPSVAFLEIGTNGTTFSNTVDLSPTDGVVSNTVFLRVTSTNVVTNYTATISHVSGSASNSLAVRGEITNVPPALAVSTNTLSGFTTTTNVASAAQTFTLTGSNLTTNVTVGAPNGFQVADDGTTWGTNTTLTPVSGSVSNTISVRLAASSVSGPVSGNVTVASTGAAQRTVAVSGLVESPSVSGLIYWNFNTATPTSGTNGDYAAWTFGPLTQSNNNGTTTLFTGTSASSGYTNPFGVAASGGTNAGAAARTGVFNADSNAFFEVQIVVPTSTTTAITNISFGSRSTSTGPATYSIRSSADGFAADVATNALTTNSTWRMNVAPVAIALSNGTNTVRIYGFGGSGNAQVDTANWRIDDLTLALAAGVGPTPIPPTITSTNAFSGTVGVAFSNDVTATGDAPIGFSGAALPGGLSVASGGSITGTPTAAGTFNVTLTATNAAGTNNQAVTFTIAKGAVSITTLPTASGLVQGQALLDSFLSGGSASVAGTFAWTDSSIIPPLGTTSYGVTFMPTDAANYNTPTTSASVTVLSTYQVGYDNWLVNYPSLTGSNTNGSADPDGDGFVNSNEYAFGTDPTIPTGSLLATIASNSVFKGSWNGPASGVTYAVQYSTNLANMAFTNDPTITIESIGGVMSFTNEATGNKFFRVRAASQ